MNNNSLEAIVNYLVENGMEESEVDHFLHQKIFTYKSILDYVREKDWAQAWNFAQAYINGDIW